MATVPQDLMDGSGNWYIPARITGLNLSKALWVRDISTMGATRYATAANRVFFAGSKGYVSALDAATGKTLWEVSPPVSLEENTHYAMGLAVTRRSLAVFVRQAMASGEVRFFNADTGELLRAELLDYEVARLVAAGGYLLALGASGEITSFSEETGERAAATRQVTTVLDAVAADDRLVLIGRERAAFSLDMAELKPLGARMFEEQVFAPLVLNGELLLFSTPEPGVIALEPHALTVKWRKPLEREPNMLPAGFGSRIFLGEAGGKLRCFDAASGKYAWTRDLEASCYVFMVFDNCVLAVADFPPENGQQQQLSPEQPSTPIASRNEPSWFKGEGAHGYCLFMLDTSDGSTIAQFPGSGYLLPQAVTPYGILVREDPGGTLACYPYDLHPGASASAEAAK